MIKDHSISRETFGVTECLDCGFLFTNPRPHPSGFDHYYQSDEYVSHGIARSSLQNRLYAAARKWALGRKFALIQRYQKNGKVLDIGCGTGEFLAHLMSRGYLAQGVEPSLRAREYAIAEHGLNVVPSVDLVAAQEQFQVLTMWHVLEHVHDPRTMFKRAFALLAEHGLFVIAVPDRESWDAQYYGTYWAAWDVPRHLSHFRRADIHALTQEHGFELVATRKMWLDAFYIALLSEQYKGTPQWLSFIKAVIIGGWSNLVSLFSDRPTSSTLYIARKLAI
jgi:2-polyprenyl-3-methyl-5-hydroxy-6-metoxy-1,4-benzoquinol methylase